jgi:hypothetical protein
VPAPGCASPLLLPDGRSALNRRAPELGTLRMQKQTSADKWYEQSEASRSPIRCERCWRFVAVSCVDIGRYLDHSFPL